MTNVLVHDSRRLVLPLDTMVDVLIEFDHAHKHWPARATLESAQLLSSGIVISLRQSGQDAPIERTYSLAIIAAAIIHYCGKMRVPIPKGASKSVQVSPEGVTMMLEGTLFLQRQHPELPARMPAGPQAAAQATQADSIPASSDPSPASQADAAAATAAGPVAQGQKAENRSA